MSYYIWHKFLKWGFYFMLICFFFLVWCFQLWFIHLLSIYHISCYLVFQHYQQCSRGLLLWLLSLATLLILISWITWGTATLSSFPSGFSPSFPLSNTLCIRPRKSFFIQPGYYSTISINFVMPRAQPEADRAYMLLIGSIEFSIFHEMYIYICVSVKIY